jgi:hypothetical protein
MRRCIVVCRHPESNQAAWELLSAMADDAGFTAITVFGVQNTTPNKARALPEPKVRVLEPADKNRLDVDQLQRELEAHKYDCMLVVHTVSVVSSVVTALQPLLAARPAMQVGLYCEVAREMCLPRHFTAIGEAAAALKDTVWIASSVLGRAEFARAGVPGVRALAPCLSLRGVNDVPRTIIEHTRTSLQTRDWFTVLALGRADTSVFMFVDFLARHRGAKAKLVLPIEAGAKEAVSHLFKHEMRQRCPDVPDPGRCLMLMSDIAHLTVEDMRALMCACDAVVHANPGVDYNAPAKVAACLPVVQVVPRREVHTAHLDPKRTVTVPCGFEFFTFDDYGGKLGLASPADLATALGEVYQARGRPVSCLPPSPDLLAETDYANWRRFLSFKREPRPCAQAVTAADGGADCGDELHEMRKQLQHLMAMLMP